MASFFINLYLMQVLGVSSGDLRFAHPTTASRRSPPFMMPRAAQVPEETADDRKRKEVKKQREAGRLACLSSIK